MMRTPMSDVVALLEALSKCRSAALMFHRATPERNGVTRIVDRRGTRQEHWHHQARPASLRVSLCGERFEHVRFKLRKGESMEALIWRALAELQRREIDGMPKPDPKAKKRREL